jgi:hypothetical protein
MNIERQTAQRGQRDGAGQRDRKVRARSRDDFEEREVRRLDKEFNQ